MHIYIYTTTWHFVLWNFTKERTKVCTGQGTMKLDMCPGLLPKVNLYLSFFNYYMTKIPF